jgi:hypothetical protein
MEGMKMATAVAEIDKSAALTTKVAAMSDERRLARLHVLADPSRSDDASFEEFVKCLFGPEAELLDE